MLGTLQPLKSFGPSVFGALRLRPVSENGERGDWQPLAKLVRIPSLKEVRCPDSPDKPCSLIGQNLFLIDSVASDSQFAHNICGSGRFCGLYVERSPSQWHAAIHQTAGRPIDGEQGSASGITRALRLGSIRLLL